VQKGKDYIGVGVGAVVVNRQGKLFLSQRGVEARNERGKWEFPGGGVEFGERLEEALIREMKEEYDLDIEPIEQLWTYDHLIPDEKQHWVSPTYFCKVKKGVPKITEPHKCSQIGWFTLPEIGTMPLSLITRNDYHHLLKRYPNGLPNLDCETRKYGTKEEQVDILLPPDFQKSGQIKPLSKAWQDGDWIGTFVLWIVQDRPTPALLYQQRSLDSSWAPGKLDVTAGGHYRAGETIRDGLREVKEELGREYKFKDLTYLGRKLHLGVDVSGGELRKNLVDMFIIRDNAPLNHYHLEKKEVVALLACPLKELLKVHTRKGYSFSAQGFDNRRHPIVYTVGQDSFTYNWDNFHFKMALLAGRFLKGEKRLIY